MIEGKTVYGTFSFKSEFNFKMYKWQQQLFKKENIYCLSFSTNLYENFYL